MNNWMEKYECEKVKARERELYKKLENLLNVLDTVYSDADKVKVIKEIIKVYNILDIENYNYDENDYKNKKRELLIRYKRMEAKHKADKASASWNEYRDEEELDK